MTADRWVAFVNILVPVVTAALAVLSVAGSALREWRARRSGIGRRKLALEDAQAQVKFVSDWWTARQQLDDPRTGSLSRQKAEADARAWLERATRLVSTTELVLKPISPPMTFTRLALLYEFRSRPGKIVRTGFFVCCGLTVIAVGAGISEWLRPTLLESRVVGWRPLASLIVSGALFAPATVALRYLAIAVDGFAARRGVDGSPDLGVVRRALLLYRMRGRGVRAVRALFLAGVIAVVLYVANYARVSMQYGAGVWLLPLTAAGTLVWVTATIGIRAWALSIHQRAGSTGRVEPGVQTESPGGSAPSAPIVPGQQEGRERISEGTPAR